MGAYNKLYLDDITELQEELFKKIARYDYELDYEIFVSGFMKCKYRWLLDKCNPRVANMTYDELLRYLEKDCSELFVKGETPVDSLMSGWIGRMYSLLQYEMCISSEELYNRLPIERMMNLFIPLHSWRRYSTWKIIEDFKW